MRHEFDGYNKRFLAVQDSPQAIIYEGRRHQRWVIKEVTHYGPEHFTTLLIPAYLKGEAAERRLREKVELILDVGDHRAA